MGRDGTYLNPVYPHSFPDPFVLKHLGHYYAYSTGHARNGRVFEVITSTDLVNWQRIGGAMEPLSTGEPFYWAPEVTYFNGRFYLYYSVGNEKFMTLRVAVSDRPDGGFVDSGVKLTTQDFAIDAHVFQDDDGSRWMFYATDFLEYSHIGTGTVVDRMIDMFTLAGDPRPVTRAKYDWQVYDPNRAEKGGVRWHTVEGPFVLKRKGTYYEMFSGGNWQNISYGVSFAVTDDLNSDDEWRQFSDGETRVPLLRTIPEKVVGPGHNSVIQGPDNRELYCVYHLWKSDERVLAIDRIGFAGGERLFIRGATWTPQPLPYRPAMAVDTGVDSVETGGSSFLFSVWIRSTGSGEFGVEFEGKNNIIGRLTLNARSLVLSCGRDTQTVQVPPDLDLAVFQELRVEVDGGVIKCSFDGISKLSGVLDDEVDTLRPIGDADIRAFTLTRGFEELFENINLETKGWRPLGNITSDGRHLSIPAGSLLRRPLPVCPFELAVNLKLEAGASGKITCGQEFAIDGNGISVGHKRFEYPATFDVKNFHQFRFVSKDKSMSIHIDSDELGSVHAVTAEEFSLLAEHGVVKLDMVSFIEI